MRHLILLLPLLLAACQTNPFPKDLPESLYNKVKTFEDVVRWGTLSKMVLFQKPDPGNPHKPQEGLENVRVTSYETAGPLSKADEYRWTQSAVIDYVLTDRQIVRQLIDNQVWASDDQGKTWFRQNPVPVFR